MRFADLWSKHRAICIFLMAVLALISALAVFFSARLILSQWKIHIHPDQGYRAMYSGDYEKAKSELEYILPYVSSDLRAEVGEKIRICTDAIKNGKQ